MKKSILALFFLFFSAIALSQTTVTLQDQCNCEVLKGTDVSSPGMVVPAGADTGDIYVNTSTGTIYFWDGNSWELTSTDDQQLTGFTFGGATNTLSLTLENGGTVNVDLSSLSDTLTDTNTTITSYGIDGANTNLVITDSEGNTFSVALADLAALIDTDTQLTDAQVATAVNSEFPNLDTDSTDDFSGDFGDLANVPANLDTDSTDDFDGEWSSLLNVPTGFSDNIDNDTQLTDAQVATAVNSEFPNLDTDSTDDFSGDFGDLANVPANLDTDSTDDFSGDFGDLANVPANLDTDSTDDFDGEWSSLLNVPAGFSDNIDNDTQLTDAQVATAVNSEFPNLDTDSTDDFSGDFGDLANVPANLDTDSTDDFSGDFGDLANVPANLDTDSTDDFDGEWSSLLNVPAGFSDNVDNDTQLTDAQVATAVNSEFPNLDTDSTDDFDGEWTSLANVPAGFSDNVDNVDDADAVVGNEYNTGSSITAGVIGITDGGGTEQVDLISNDVNNNLSFGSDGALYLNVASVSIAETITNLVDNNDGTVTYTNENGVAQTVNKSSITDNLDGTYTFDNGNGSPITFVGTDNDTQLTDAQVATAVNSEFPNLDTDSTDDFDGEWSSLLNVPAGFSDNVDNDTQLTDAQVATAVNSEFPNLDTDSTDDFSGDFGDLANVPANLDTDSTDDFSGDFGDLANVPANLDTDSTDDFDGEWSSLLNVPAGFSDNVDNDTQLTDAQVATAVNSEFPNLDTDSTDDFSGDFGDLANVPTNLDTDSTDDFDGEWSSLLNVPAGFSDNVDNVDDADNDPANELQSIASADGTITVTPSGNNFDLSGFSGDFGDLANVPANLDTDSTDDFSGDFGDLANVPANLDTDSTDDFSGDFGDLANVPANLDTDSTDDFDGEWSSLLNVPAGFSDNVDNVDDADAVVGNEYNTGSSITAGVIGITDGGGTEQVDLISNDVNNNLSFGSDGALYLNVASVSIAETITNLVDNNDGTVTYTNENGVAQTVNKSSITDNLDGTYTFDNGNGSPITFVGTDNDTQLTDAQVATAVNSEFPNLDTDSTDDFDGEWTSLLNVPANLDTDSTDDFDGEWTSLANVPAGFSDNVDNVDDADNDPANELQSIASADGTITVTPSGNNFDLSGFSGDFGDLANVPVNLDTDSTDDFSGDFGDLANVPANLDTDSTDDFDGEWSSLLNVPAGFSDNIDNDTQLTDAQVATAVNSEFPNLDTDSTDDFSGDFGDLANVPANLDTDSTDDFDGEWSSLLNVPAGFSDNADNVDDADNDPANELQSIASADGTITVTPSGNNFDLSGFSGDFGDLANVPANLDTDSTDDFSGDFGDLANVPANLDTDSTDDFDGEWSSLLNVPAGFSDNVDNVDDADNDPANELQSIASADGTITVTPSGNNFDLSGFSGDFGDLANVPVNLDTDSTDDFSGDFGDLANVPANLDTDSTDDFDGEWSSLANVPAGFSDNVDNVDDADNDPANELQSIASADGTITVTPSGNNFDLSGFSGDFGDLANVPANLDTDSTDDFSGDFGDLANVPANLDTDSTDDFDGEWSSLLNVPAGFSDNVDNVDDADPDPLNEIQNLGEVLADGNDGGGVAITNIADPTNAQDAATKAYVDNISDDDVSVTNTVVGNRIATISEPGITAVDIRETITSLSQNTSTGVISYIDEDGGTPATANVVSADANNELSIGADGGASFEMTDIDMDGDGAAEATIDNAMTDIAKVTTKAARIFYPPSIAINASSLVNNTTIDLYQEYINQFGSPTMASTGAPAAVPTYTRTELYYYVTYADPSVLNIDSISANGVMQYDVVGTPADYNALINVVFVVK